MMREKRLNAFMIDTITEMKNTMRKNIYYETTDAESTTMDDGRGVNNKKGGKDVDLDEFDECTCSGDTYYDI